MRKVFTIVLSVTVALSGYTFFSDHASANQQLKGKINEVHGKRVELHQDSNEKKSEINQIERDQAQVNAEIKRIDLAVAETSEKIRKKEGEIKTTKAEIEKLGAQIKELEIKIKKRDEALKTRVRSVQESGGVVSYLDVLLGAKSFGDFLDRVNAVTVIVQQDKDILQAHVNDQQMLEQLKAKQQAQLTGLEQKRAELKSDQQTLLSQKGQKEKLMAELKEKEQQIEDELLDLAEQDEILRKQEASYKKLLAQWQEQQRRIEEAKKRGEKPPISDGSFSRPANGPVTSNYGSRWGKLHAGIDIGKRGSSVPIVAAADGIVFRSYYSSSYGNVVFVSHNINGKMYTTLYAHMESRKVSEGASVSKGDILGYMGNTGRSYGAHLHFEIHEGSWNAAKSNSVDPRKYVNF